MSNLHRIDAKITEFNGQPSQSAQHPQLRRRANGQLYDPLHPTQPEKVYATILDPNGDPIDRNKPYPLLRRTASGHLFQPKTPAVPERESPSAQPSTRDPIDTNSVKIPAVRLQPFKYHTPRSLGTGAVMGQGPAIPVHLVNETLERRSVVPMRDTVSSESSPPQPKQLIEKAPPYTLRNVGHTSDLRGQAALHAKMYDADDEASPKKPSKLSTDTGRGVNPTTVSEWNKRVAKENADDRRMFELRDAEQKELRYENGEAVRERTQAPLPKNVRHRFDRDDSGGKSNNSSSTNTMTITNSVTGAKKEVRFDLYTIPGDPLAKKEENDGSEDIWAQVADD